MSLMDLTLAQHEQALLACCLRSPSTFTSLASVLTPEHFTDPARKGIWTAFNALVADGRDLHVLAVGSWLTTHRDDANGATATDVHTLYALDWAQPAAYLEYAAAVVQAWQQREVGKVGSRLAQVGRTEARQGRLPSPGRRSPRSTGIRWRPCGGGPCTDDRDVSRFDARPAPDDDRPRGVPTGLRDLDEIIGGVRPGQAIVGGAAPGVGKTAFMQSLVRHIACDLGRPVLSFTLEMDRDELTFRLLSDLARVKSERFTDLDARLTDAEWAKVANVLPTVQAMRWHICDDTSITVPEIVAMIGQVKRRYGDLALVTIDYAGLMIDDESRKDTRAQLAQITRSLKKAAKRHQVPVLLLSQVNRNYADKSNGMPAMADLAGSSTFEQDADVVLLLHRDDRFEREHERAGEMDIVVAKQRGGRTGACVVSSRLQYYRVANFGPDDYRELKVPSAA
ncbi:MAG: replicative DNA helicase [Cellulomonas sp.]|uniref:replicative DNA helicase n=1 Tax=Cellulomonas sp. TaxID=40001 RepID=UPI00258C491B|nr:DnaB-like helicase C-terminal domain-containing protein [Cellulomonas sp.]MCR6706188.1 replicative DNA helicase [Cellulomonas sp.]